MRTKKTEQLISYPFYHTDGIARHLEKRARQGWLLEHTDALGWHFRRGDPQALHYTVLYDPKATGYEPEPTEEQRTLADFCAHGGWQLLPTTHVTQVYVSDREAPTPIHTDPVIALQSLRRFGKKRLLLPWLLLVLSVLTTGLAVHSWRTNFIGSLLDSTVWLSQLSMLVMGISCLVYLLPWYRYCRKAARAAEQGDFVSTMGHPYLLQGLMALFLLLLAWHFVRAWGTDQFASIALHAGVYLALTALACATRAYLKRQKADADTNRTTTMAVYLTVALLMLPFLLAGRSTGGTHLPRLPGPPALTVEQLLGPVEGREAQLVHDLWGSSPALTEIVGYDRCYTGEEMTEDPAQPQLSYTQLDIHWAPVYEACLRDTLQGFDWARDDHPGLAYEARPAPKGVDAFYALNQPINDSYPCILCWEDRIVTLYPSWPLSEAQLSLAAAALAP